MTRIHCQILPKIPIQNEIGISPITLNANAKIPKITNFRVIFTIADFRSRFIVCSRSA